MPNKKKQHTMKKNILFNLFILFFPIFLLAQPKVIAHRGFWNTKGSAQNSIAALVKADSINAYGSEFDVQISKDSVLVINHDPHLWGYHIAKTSAETLTSLGLANREAMPTLIDYFNAAKPLKTKLILELKSLESPEMESYAIDEILKLVKEYGYEDRFEFISFSLHAVKDIVKKSPSTPIYYLSGNLSPKELKEIGNVGLDYHFNVFNKNPEWVKEAHDLGLKVNTWTVNKKEDMQKVIDLNVDFITTDEPVLLRDLLNNSL